MTRKMIKPMTVAAALLAGSAAMALTPVESVEVDVDLSAIQNERAATYWTDIADDLETAIVSRLTPQLADDGASISVDIDEVSLANTFERTFSTEDSFLIGDVKISGEPKYTLKVSFEQARVFMPENVDLTTITFDSPYYYTSMIDAFADNVANKLQ